MGKILITIAFILLGLDIARSQESFTKVVIDGETGRPISNVHVYLANHLKTGTITNEDGRFILKNVNKNDILEVSHLSYTPFVGAIYNINSDTVSLFKSALVLDEILVINHSDRTIMASVIDSLYVNHFVEPVMYEVYVRVAQFEQDYSELHVLSEYVMNVYQNKKHNSEFSVIKTRAKPFSGAGKKYFKDMRVMHAIAINSNNIFKYKYDIFKEKKLKNYEVVIIEEVAEGEFNLLELHIYPKKKEEFSSITLLIDQSSYAVKKMIVYYSESKQEFEEVGFKQIKDRWYLDYSKKTIYSTFFSKWQPGSKSTLERIAIYNINELVEHDSKNFKSVLNIIAEPIKLHIGDWSDNFWESYNYVPLPAWIQNKITDSGSL
jgi:carboxypeptidase-like protein